MWIVAFHLMARFAAATGKIAKLDKRPLMAATNETTIGIRGTEFWVGALNAAPHVELRGGSGVFVEDAGARVNMMKPGWVSSSRTPRPSPSARLLAQMDE